LLLLAVLPRLLLLAVLSLLLLAVLPLLLPVLPLRLPVLSGLLPVRRLRAVLLGRLAVSARTRGLRPADDAEGGSSSVCLSCESGLLDSRVAQVSPSLEANPMM